MEANPHQPTSPPIADSTIPAGTPAAEFALDSAFVARLLHDQHPDLADLPLQLFEAGWDNMMFRLGDQLVVRLPRRAAAAELIRNEQSWLPQIAHQLALPIPVPERIGRPAHGYPWHWSIVRWLGGQPADQHEPHAHQAEPFGTFLRSLHTPAPADAPINTLRGVPLSHRAAVVEQRMQRAADKSALITPTIRQIWQEALAAPVDRPATWLHGDLHPRNILVDQGSISGIIDWGDITAGDCATDLAAIWMLFADRQARQRALQTYAESLSTATLRRARGWAVLFGVFLLDAGLINDDRMALIGERTLGRLAEREP